jgi:hypothetical protein
VEPRKEEEMKEDDVDGACSMHGRDMRHADKIFAGKPEGERPFRRHRRKWEENMRMGLTETGLEGVDWILLAQDRVQWWALVNTMMNIKVQ